MRKRSKITLAVLFFYPLDLIKQCKKKSKLDGQLVYCYKVDKNHIQILSS